MLEKLATKNVPVLGWAQPAFRINPDLTHQHFGSPGG